MKFNYAVKGLIVNNLIVEIQNKEGSLVQT